MRIPDWKLERYLLGELDPKELERIGAEAETDEELKERLESFRRSDEEIRERYPSPWMARRIQNRLSEIGTPVRDKKAPWTGFLARPMIPVGAVALLLILVVWPFAVDHDTNRDIQSPGSEVRIKGEPALQIYRKTPDGSERLSEGALVRERDVILIRYQPAGRPYGAIVSIDGRGVVTRHLPAEGDQAAELPNEGTASVEFAYELDDAPRGERFYFITSDVPFDLEPILAGARAMKASVVEHGLPDRLDLDERFDQVTFTLSKEQRHE